MLVLTLVLPEDRHLRLPPLTNKTNVKSSGQECPLTCTRKLDRVTTSERSGRRIPTPIGGFVSGHRFSDAAIGPVRNGSRSVRRVLSVVIPSAFCCDSRSPTPPRSGRPRPLLQRTRHLRFLPPGRCRFCRAGNSR